MAGPVSGAYLQKVAQLGLQGVQRDAAGGVVAAERVHHVVGEEALHVVQHARGAQVELLHLLRRQEGGLAIGAADREQKAGERGAPSSRWNQEPSEEYMKGRRWKEVQRGEESRLKGSEVKDS